MEQDKRVAVVELLGGSPKLTVLWANGETILVCWITPSGEYKTAELPIHAVREVHVHDRVSPVSDEQKRANTAALRPPTIESLSVGLKR